MPKERKVGVDVQCISCKKTRFIGHVEAAQIQASGGVAMCDDCYMPMVLKRAYA